VKFFYSLGCHTVGLVQFQRLDGLAQNHVGRVRFLNFAKIFSLFAKKAYENNESFRETKFRENLLIFVEFSVFAKMKKTVFVSTLHVGPTLYVCTVKFLYSIGPQTDRRGGCNSSLAKIKPGQRPL
jgi:hypothetical protein